jgi:H+/Cl- antiporter ClcA
VSVGRLLIFAGLLLICLGAAVVAIEKINLPLGRLPGDIVWRGKRTSFYFPVVTCLLLSLVGSLVLWIAGKFR